MSEPVTYHIVERDRMTGWERHFWVSGEGLTSEQADAEVEKLGKMIVSRYGYRKEQDGTDCTHA